MPPFRFLSLLLALVLISGSAAGVYKVKKRTPESRPAFSSPAEERDWRLRKGEILTEGGYEGKSVWGKMEGLVEAPPEVVWEIFLDANRWKEFRFPTLMDSRWVTEAIARQVEAVSEVDHFYRVLEKQIFGSGAFRRKGERWRGYTFQYYNVPWPVANRWMILDVIHDERAGPRGAYRADWTRAAGNVITIDGYLVAEPFEGNRRVTRMEYRALSNPGAHVPRFLVRWGINRIMPAVIRAVRREAVRRAGSSSVLLEDPPAL